MGVLSSIKSRLVPDECRVRLVSFGLFKGLRFEINLRSQAQLYLGLLERETYRAIRRAAQTAEWFVDIGAGKGELCAFFVTLQRIKRVGTRSTSVLPLVRYLPTTVRCFCSPASTVLNSRLAYFSADFSHALRIIGVPYADWPEIVQPDVSFEKIVAGAVAFMTERAPTGPLLIAGQSYGGHVAYAAALALSAAGRSVVQKYALDGGLGDFKY